MCGVGGHVNNIKPSKNPQIAADSIYTILDSEAGKKNDLRFVLFTGTSVFVYIFEVTDFVTGGWASHSLRFCGVVQTPGNGGVGRELGADIYKCCGCSEIWQPYFTMCDARITHARRHNSGIISLQVHLCACVNM